MPQLENELSEQSVELDENQKEIKKEDDLKEESEKLHLKTKPVPAIVTLAGGSVAAVYTYIQHYPFKDALIVILVSLIVFMVIGDVVRYFLDKIEIDPPVSEEEAEESEAGDDSEGTETEDVES